MKTFLSRFPRTANRFGLGPLSAWRASARLNWWPTLTCYKILRDRDSVKADTRIAATSGRFWSTISRNYDDETGLFVVNGRGCGVGLGFQLRLGSVAYGFSVVWRERR